MIIMSINIMYDDVTYIFQILNVMSLYAKIYLIYARTYLKGNGSPSWHLRLVKVYAIKMHTI